jgi:hypothetical protein
MVKRGDTLPAGRVPKLVTPDPNRTLPGWESPRFPAAEPAGTCLLGCFFKAGPGILVADKDSNGGKLNKSNQGIIGGKAGKKLLDSVFSGP